jgi:hypothetical protein
MKPGDTVRSLRSHIFAPVGRATEPERSAMVSPSISISVGPSKASLRPSNRSPQMTTVFVIEPSTGSAFIEISVVKTVTMNTAVRVSSAPYALKHCEYDA